MKRFWGFYDNGTFRVGCNGASISVYDRNGAELAKFRDIPYAYIGAFQPGTNIFVAKSTEGALAVYDLERLTLLKKIRITRIGGQDEGFAFTPDGTYFYNIEKPFDTTQTQLTIYRTSDFTVSEILFADNKNMTLNGLEFDDNSGICYVLGCIRRMSGGYSFIGKLSGGDISDIKELQAEDYDYISAYMDWELSGRTEKCLAWSRLKGYADKPPISLKRACE